MSARPSSCNAPVTSAPAPQGEHRRHDVRQADPCGDSVDDAGDEPDERADDGEGAHRAAERRRLARRPCSPHRHPRQEQEGGAEVAPPEPHPRGTPPVGGEPRRRRRNACVLARAAGPASCLSLIGQGRDAAKKARQPVAIRFASVVPVCSSGVAERPPALTPLHRPMRYRLADVSGLQADEARAGVLSLPFKSCAGCRPKHRFPRDFRLGR